MADALQFSADELTVLAQMLGGSEFPGIGSISFSAYSTETRAVAARAARRGLVARGFITLNADGEVLVLPGPKELIERALNPALMVTVEQHDSRNVDARRFFADAESMVEHRGFLGGVSELVMRPTGELLDAIVGMTGIVLRPVSDAPPLTTTFGELRAVRTADLDHESPLPSDHPLIAAIQSDYSLTVLSTVFTVEDRVEGEWIGWFDARDDGIWQIDMNASSESIASEPSLTLFPVSARELLDAVTQGLPGGNGSRQAQVDSVGGM